MFAQPHAIAYKKSEHLAISLGTVTLYSNSRIVFLRIRLGFWMINAFPRSSVPEAMLPLTQWRPLCLALRETVVDLHVARIHNDGLTGGRGVGS